MHFLLIKMCLIITNNCDFSLEIEINLGVRFIKLKINNNYDITRSNNMYVLFLFTGDGADLCQIQLAGFTLLY